MKYDVVVIGGGPGGYVCAIRSAQYGLKTALVERDLIGGTCLNRGCIPTKTILRTAELFREAHEAERFGVRIEGAAIDFKALRARCGEVTKQLRNGISVLLKQNGVDVFNGTGHVSSLGNVTVANDSEEHTLLEASDIVLAVGSKPSMPPIPGADRPGVYTSDSLLALLPDFRSITIIGGGVVGVEFAEAYLSLGAEVTLIEALPRILTPFDRELALHLAARFKKRGARIIAGAAVERIEEGLTCVYSTKGETQSAVSEGILIATGRSADTEDICEPECMPSSEHGRLLVDDNFLTSVPHIYAVGDAALNGPQLAHAASAQGEAVAARLAGKQPETDLTFVPSCVYTSPEIASVGLTESETKERFGTAKTGKFLMGANGKSLILGQDGFVKLVADGDGILRGAQLFCAGASDLIGEAALAIRMGLTARVFAEQVRAHPTLEEALGEAAAAIDGMAVHVPPLRRR